MRNVAFPLLILLLLVPTLKATEENVTASELEEIKSLNEVKHLQILGDLISVVEKNVTEAAPEGVDAFDDYLRTHLVRIQSPLQDDRYFYFELDRLIPAEETEGRQKKRKGAIRDVLIPLLLMIKHKLSVALPLFLAMVTFVAFKGFWAGMSALVISKVIGLKLLLQAQEKQNEEEQDQDEDRDHNEQEESEKPIVIHLNSHSHRRRISNRRLRPARRRYHGPETWDPWGRQRDFEKSNWDGKRPN